MLNVNKITSMLAKLPDQQLQQYAQMHKNDPYIMALAMSESSRRKEVRAAGQTAPEQPKVVDQAVAEMAPQRLPEEQGIGQIPAGNMNFAEGGIIAFADGGDVERYQYGGGTRVPVTASGPYAIPGMTLPATPFLPQAGTQEDVPWLRRKFNEMADEGFQYQLAQAQSRIAAGQGTSADAAIIKEAEARSARAAAAPKTEVAADAAANNRSLLNRAEQRTMPTVGTGAGAGTGSGGAADKSGATPALSPTMQAPRVGGLDVAAMTKKALDAAAAQPNPFAADVEAIGKEKVAAKEAKVSGLEAIQKQFSDIYKGRKERLDKKEGDIEKMKDQSLGLALLQAGASMMSTRGGIGMAIGKGVEVGTQQYAAGLDKVRSAQEKLSDARDRLEEIEAQRGEMSARELNKARNEVKTAGIGAREDLLKANMQMYGVNRETALKMVDNQVKVGIAQLEQAGLNARAAMPSGEMRAAMMLGTGPTDAAKLESGMKKLQEIQTDKTGMAAFKVLGEINAKHANDINFKPLTLDDLMTFTRQYSASMYPKVGNVAPTRDRP